MRRVRVIRVVDGDTVHVIPWDAPLEGTKVEKVRLRGIDAPESKQEYGAEATAALHALLFPNQNVWLESDSGPDKYGRTLGRLWTTTPGVRGIGNVEPPHMHAVDVNLAMVRGGHAWVYRKYPFPAGYDEAEQLAKRSVLIAPPNLWANPNAEPPWEWRHRTKRHPWQRKQRRRQRYRYDEDQAPAAAPIAQSIAVQSDFY